MAPRWMMANVTQVNGLQGKRSTATTSHAHQRESLSSWLVHFITACIAKQVLRLADTEPGARDRYIYHQWRTEDLELEGPGRENTKENNRK